MNEYLIILGSCLIVMGIFLFMVQTEKRLQKIETILKVKEWVDWKGRFEKGKGVEVIK